MREKKVIYRFVCDAMLKMAKPKMGVKSSDSDYAHLMDFRVCHQNKTKLVFSCFFCCFWFMDVLLCDKVQNVTPQNTKNTNNNQQNIKIPESNLVLFW